MALSNLSQDALHTLMMFLDGVSILTLWAVGDKVIQNHMAKSPSFLFLIDSSFLAHWPRSMVSRFANLRELSIKNSRAMGESGMHHYKELPPLPNLRKLSLRFTQAMQTIPVCLAKCFPLLTHLTIDGFSERNYLSRYRPFPPGLVKFSFADASTNITPNDIAALPDTLETLKIKSTMRNKVGEILFPPNIVRLVYHTSGYLSGLHLPPRLTTLSIHYDGGWTSTDRTWTPDFWTKMPSTLTRLDVSNSGYLPRPKPGELPNSLQHLTIRVERESHTFNNEASFSIGKILAHLPLLKTMTWDELDAEAQKLGRLMEADVPYIPLLMEQVRLYNLNPSSLRLLPSSIKHLTIRFSPEHLPTSELLTWPSCLTRLHLCNPISLKSFRLPSTLLTLKLRNWTTETMPDFVPPSLTYFALPRDLFKRAHMVQLPRLVRLTFMVTSRLTTLASQEASSSNSKHAKELNHEDYDPIEDEEFARLLPATLQTIEICGLTVGTGLQRWLAAIPTHVKLTTLKVFMFYKQVEMRLKELKRDADEIKLSKGWTSWPPHLTFLRFKCPIFAEECISKLPRGLRVLKLLPLVGINLTPEVIRLLPPGLRHFNTVSSESSHRVRIFDHWPSDKPPETSSWTTEDEDEENEDEDQLEEN